MDKKEYIDFRIEQANDDWEAVISLFESGKYLQALFFSHLVIEKIIKAHWIKANPENFPPKTHNLIFLTKSLSIELHDEILKFLLKLNKFQIEGRYPDYINNIRKECNRDYTNSIINKTNEVRLWLLEKI